MIRPLITVPNKMLKQTSVEVSSLEEEAAQGKPAFADETVALIGDMVDTMYAFDGLGLAAVQVGELKRVVVLQRPEYHPDIDESKCPTRTILMVNPEITWYSDTTVSMKEGCLSYPGVWIDVVRPANVGVRAQDLEGRWYENEAYGLYGRIVQHEVDHLNGISFLDRVGSVKRNMILKKLKKKGF